MYISNAYINSCAQNCTSGTKIINGVKLVTTCSQPINNQCIAGYANSANSGQWTDCSGYCSVSMKK